MRDHDPRNASFESDDGTTAGEAAYESVRDLETSDDWSRPSLSRVPLGSLDIHDRPTLVP